MNMEQSDHGASLVFIHFRLYWSRHKLGRGAWPLQSINFWCCHHDSAPFVLDSLITDYIQAKGGGGNNYNRDWVQIPHMLYPSGEFAEAQTLVAVAPRVGLSNRLPRQIQLTDFPQVSNVYTSLYFS